MTERSVEPKQRWRFIHGGFMFDVTVIDLALDGEIVHGRLHAGSIGSPGDLVTVPTSSVLGGEMVRPAELEVGQRWGVWVYDERLHVCFTIERLDEHSAFGVDDEDGAPVMCGRKRFEDADYLGMADG